jgi:hypothetical protein
LARLELQPRTHRILGWSSLALGLACAGSAGAQVLDVDLGSSVYLEPSKTSKLTVINPSIALEGHIAGAVDVSASYEADIVSGATESIKGGRLATVDIVSSATNFDDTRHVASGGLRIRRENTELGLGYSYGTESDYRSHAISVNAGTTFLQKNTELTLSYARGFDEVCTTDFDDSDAPSSRLPLDSSDGCFTKAEGRNTRDVSIDNFQAGWTQAWTPVLVTQLIWSAGLQHGFLENPYRAVVIAPSGDAALENHPDNRARTALALRGRLYVRQIETAFSAGVRLYRDTWDVFGQNYELAAERYLFAGLRIQARGRYYTQTEALFYSDDYTGGEPVDGPNGQYWSGDRELSPLHNLQYGGRVLFSKRGASGARVLGVFLGLTASASFDIIDTSLDRFTWGGVEPDDTTGLLGSVGVKAEF